MENRSSNVVELGNKAFAIPKYGIVASLKKGRKKNTGKPTTSVDKDLGSTDLFMPWGDNNLFPNDWEKDIEENDTLRDAFEKEIDRVYAGGLEYGYIRYTQEGEKEIVSFQNDEIDRLFYSPMGQYAFEQQISDYVKHRVPVPEIILSEDRQKVIGLSALPAAHWRWGKQKDDGYIMSGFFSRNWRTHRTAGDENTKEINVIDPLVDLPYAIKASKSKNYVYRTPFAGHRTYYDLSPGYSAKSTGWLPISNDVVAFYRYLFKNQMSPKFHIEIDVNYMKSKYKEEWTEATGEDRNKLLLKELEEFQAMLHGVENTGNNIVTLKEINKILGKEYSLWTITKLDPPDFTTGQLELLETADLHIQRAVGVDPSMQGSTGGSKMGGGSGSDKREAFNIRMATAQRHVDRILSVYYWIIQYNGITGPNGEKIHLRMKTPYLQTLNNVTPDQRSTKIKEE